ncbi:MAG: DUF2752 domain-containing protein [Rikenella sp.]|nr:DUF2752 domain-containing protein [Rikenella sp.]
MGLMPCAYRQLLGIDCPFCGAQRSALLLLQGRFTESFRLFPALVPIAVTPLFARCKKVLPILLGIDAAIVVGSWLLRMAGV